jgi:hypothetical protein
LTRVPACDNLDLIATLQAAEVPDFGTQARLVGMHELRCGMVINGEVRAKNGLLLFAKGQEVTEALIERLKNFAMSSGVVQPFSVIVPKPVEHKRANVLGVSTSPTLTESRSLTSTLAQAARQFRNKPRAARGCDVDRRAR